jgi:hypothetical protein
MNFPEHPMTTNLLWPCVILLAAPAEVAVTGIQAIHRDGQTFVTWKDAAEGEAGASFRYALYRSPKPITQQNLAEATLCYDGILYNSGKLYGSAFNRIDRLDPAKPMATIVSGGKPLPLWSGLAVHTAREAGPAYFAVVATDEERRPLSQIVPGQSASTEPIEERPAPIQPIKLYDSRERTGPYVKNTSISGKRGLPLHVTLHGSSGGGGGAGEYGDYYLYFGTPAMGHRDGLPGVFSISESRETGESRLLLRPRYALEHPSGLRAMETYWLGYSCVPQGASHEEPRFYPYTANQVLWMVDWAVKHYGADPSRVTMGGSSSGAVGSMNVGFRHPEVFCALFPSVGRVRKVPGVALEGKRIPGESLFLADGKTNYLDYVDGPRFAREHHEDLPFLGWACGRNDGYATWQEHIDMVQALTDGHHGFAFSWNNGNHGGGGAAMREIAKYYPGAKFALKQSYPAFGNSSLNHKMGSGDPKEGDLEGGINLGFDWQDVSDTETRWSAAISNSLAQADMTVDVTPRRCQEFRPKPGDKIQWTSSLGTSGTATVDAWGLATVKQLVLRPGSETTLTLEAAR